MRKKEQSSTNTQMDVPAVSALQRKGAKEVITTKEEFLQYDRFKWGTADILYDPNHHYCIGRLARVLLDEYSKLLGAREIHHGIDYTGEEYSATYTNVALIPHWIREDYYSTPRADTAPAVLGKWYMYCHDWEHWFEAKFLGIRSMPLWD